MSSKKSDFYDRAFYLFIQRCKILFESKSETRFWNRDLDLEIYISSDLSVKKMSVPEGLLIMYEHTDRIYAWSFLAVLFKIPKTSYFSFFILVSSFTLTSLALGETSLLSQVTPVPCRMWVQVNLSPLEFPDQVSKSTVYGVSLTNIV